jgi:hypothetical protein
MHTTEPLVLEPSSLEVEIAIENLKRYKLPGTDKMLAEMIEARGNTLHSEIHIVINSILNREEWPQQWKESVIPIYEKDDKTDCSNYRGISLLPTIYKILPNIFLPRLTSYVDEIIGHQHTF